jgi:hypothetical protein
MPTLPDVIEETHRLIDAAQSQGLFLRLIGGLAIRMHSRDPKKFFTRAYPDIDFVTYRDARRKLEPFFLGMDYVSNRQFNLLNGAQRQIYEDEATGRHIDIFLGDFEMCHKLPLEGRLGHDPVTVPLAELLLSKAQIVELNRKDALDLASLLLFNELGDDDHGKINLKHIAHLCSDDWGLYKTTSLNLKRVEEIVSEKDLPLADEERALILSRVGQILNTFETMPKPLAWQLRDRVGTRVRWYTEVEEVRR